MYAFYKQKGDLNVCQVGVALIQQYVVTQVYF